MSEPKTGTPHIINFCKHVYNHIGTPICPICWDVTHDIDWAEAGIVLEEWKISGKGEYAGWTSI